MLGPRLHGDERLPSIFRYFLFSAGFRKNPHRNDHESCRHENEMSKFRPDRRAAPIRENDRNNSDHGGNIGFDVIRHAIATAARWLQVSQAVSSIISNRDRGGLIRLLRRPAQVFLQVAYIVAVEQVPDNAAIEV
jgi:hypothetical protein